MSKYGTDLLNLWVDHIERCGFILQGGQVVEVRNTHENPNLGFRMAEADMKMYEDRIITTWHTHPQSGPNLSVPDYFLFCQFPQWEHVIISEYSFRIYRAIGSRVLICEND